MDERRQDGSRRAVKRFEVELTPQEREEVALAVGRRTPGASRAWLLAAARQQADVGALLRELAGLTSVLAALRGSFADVANEIGALADELRRHPSATDAAFRANALLESSERVLGEHEVALAESREQVRAVVHRLVAVWAALERPPEQQ